MSTLELNVNHVERNQNMLNLSNENIIVKSNGDIQYIQFKKLLEYGIKHAYTLRGENLDFSFDSEFEKSSYERLAKSLEIDEKFFVKPVQTHTSIVKCIDKVTESTELQDVDGLITNQKNIALTTKNADCILFLFYDPVKKVIANVHSGWKGTFQKISEKAVQKMRDFYACKPENIICCICPSIRKCHFEVDNDVKDLCSEIFSFTNRLDEFIEVSEIKDGKQKYKIDTVKINQIILEDFGLKPENIIDCGICSVCNSDKIHSARAEGENFKRATAVICL